MHPSSARPEAGPSPGRDPPPGRRRPRFVIELYKDDRALGRARVEEEIFDPLLEWLQFLAIRIGRLPAVCDRPARVRLAPVWDGERGPPYIREIQAALLLEEDGRETAILERSIPLRFFKRQAEAASAALLKDAKPKEGEVVHYRVSAFIDDAEPSAATPAGGTGAGGSFQALEEPRRLPLDDLPIEELLSRAVLQGEGPGEEMPFFMPRGVIAETEALKREAGNLETGGLLIGLLHRAPALPEVYVEVTAQIPAQHTRAASTRLTFTADTWTAAQAAIDLRRRKELMVGWWHTHPAREWCRDCDPSRWPHCPLARRFFSDEDFNLHRAIFPRAYSTALVLGDRVTAELTWESSLQLYGWELGMMLPRPFHLLEAASEGASGSGSRGPKGGNGDAQTH